MTTNPSARWLVAAVLIFCGCDTATEHEGAADAPADQRPEPTSGVDCTAAGLGADELTVFVSAHPVVDGELGDLCYGDPDERLVEAWGLLELIVPAGQLNDLGLFAGMVSGELGDEVTLAFVNSVDDDGSQFQMSVNLDAYSADEDEALLTLAHEFSHVFTSVSTQVDRSAEAADRCTTFYNGESCFLPDSLIAQWVADFWTEPMLDEIDPFAAPASQAGADRCTADSGFFGPYAASHPEEDFADSFAAFVFDLDTRSDGQELRMAWFAERPGLVEFRENARQAGLAPLENSFAGCGSAEP